LSKYKLLFEAKTAKIEFLFFCRMDWVKSPKLQQTREGFGKV